MPLPPDVLDHAAKRHSVVTRLELLHVLGCTRGEVDGQPTDQPLLGVLDTVARRNAFGRQVASFEADLDVGGVDGPVRAVFIRAPWFEDTGPDVEVLAKVDTPLGDKVVVVRQRRLLASAFHPELVGDDRLHRLFLDIVKGL